MLKTGDLTVYVDIHTVDRMNISQVGDNCEAVKKNDNMSAMVHAIHLEC